MESILSLFFGFCSSALVFHTFNILVPNIKSIEGILFIILWFVFTYIWNLLFSSKRNKHSITNSSELQSKTQFDSMV
jgi:hypothetical protein